MNRKLDEKGMVYTLRCEWPDGSITGQPIDAPVIPVSIVPKGCVRFWLEIMILEAKPMPFVVNVKLAE